LNFEPSEGREVEDIDILISSWLRYDLDSLFNTYYNFISDSVVWPDR